MKKILILFGVVAFFTSFLFFGCDALQNEPEDSESSETESLSVSIEPSAANVDKLYIGITLEETISIMGFRDRSVSSRLHPFRYEWDLDDGSILCMTFVIEDYENISAGWRCSSSSFDNGTGEIPRMPEEILKDIREKTLASKCTFAYIKNGSETTTIE